MVSVSVSREYGSGGDVIAQRLAERLGIPLLDRELLEVACQTVDSRVGPAYESCLSAKRPIEESTISDEEPRGLAERLEDAIAGAARRWPRVQPPAPIPVGEDDSLVRLLVSSDEAYVDTMSLVFQRVLDRENAVFVGRGGQVILANHPQVLHVYIAAPVADRVRRVAAEEGVTEYDASAKVERVDEERGRYIKRYFNADWKDPALYHLAINTGRLDDNQAVAVILRAAELIDPIRKNVM